MTRSERSLQASETTGFVHARSLRGLLDLADALGADRHGLSRSIGIDSAILAVPEASVPVEKYYALQAEILRVTGNLDFGLLSGRISHMQSAPLLLYLACASDTLRDWLNILPSTRSLLGDLGSVEVGRYGNAFALEWHPLRTPDPQRCLLTDKIIAGAALQMDGFCLLPVRPVRVDLTYRQPADLDELHHALGTNLHFEQPLSKLHYARETLDYPQLNLSVRLYEAVSEEFSAFFSEGASASDPFSLGLHAAIRRQLPTGHCSIDSVAQNMNVSRRTLQRRLGERSTSFQQLLQGVKSSLARKYLDDGNLSNIEIAFLLGYGDPSSFSAAFKSWVGRTPSEYRRLSAA